MELKEYAAHDAVGLAELVAKGEVSAHELLETSLDAIAVANPEVNAVTALREAAARAEVEEGLPEGPLRGVPYLFKDLNVFVRDLPATNGCRLYSDCIPDHESELVRRLRAAGIVPLGLTNTPEFGMGSSTEPTLTGPTRNPWDYGFAAGGSSGGSAAAVAAGMVPAAHASDGGGSIRMPSSCCGVFGLKVSRGRNTVAPDGGESWNGLSVAHAITRSVRDSAMLLDLTAAPHLGDPYWAPPPPRPYAEEVELDPGRLRIALLLEVPGGGVEVAPESIDAALNGAKLCEELGHIVEAAEWPVSSRLPRAPWEIIAPQLAHTVDARLLKLGRAQRSGDLERYTADFVELGRRTKATAYVKAVEDMHAWGRAMAEFMSVYDIVLTPTLGMTTPPIGLLDPNLPADEEQMVIRTRMNGFTVPFNISGQPAMSVPLHWTDRGMPQGVQFAARYGDESTLFRLAAQLERAAPWFNRRPGALFGENGLDGEETS